MENGNSFANNDISVKEYQTSDAQELLRLMFDLQITYFPEIVSKLKQELDRETDAMASYRKYIDEIQEDATNTWKILMAKTVSEKTIGFIIGSITVDEDLVNGSIGKIEDWFVEKEFRSQGAGMLLYKTLENWFIEKGCDQVESDTWAENEISIKAHQKLGFTITGVQFGKKLG